MANYETGADLKKFILQMCGEMDDGTSEYDTKALERLNRAHTALLSGGAELGIDVGKPWPWAQNKYPKVLALSPQYDALTVTATLSSTGITFGSAPAENLQDWYIRIGSEPECYRISSHTGTSTSATLDAAYINATATASACVIFKIDYDLDASILRLSSPFKTYRSVGDSPTLDLIEEATFSREYPIHRMIEGVPTKVCQIYKSNDTMKPRIRINCIPDEILRIEYNYIPVPSAITDSSSSYPLVPLDHRITLGYYGAYLLALDKNDNRAPEYRELARAGIIAMQKAGSVEKVLTNEMYGRLIAREDLHSVNTNRGGDY